MLGAGRLFWLARLAAFYREGSGVVLKYIELCFLSKKMKKSGTLSKFRLPLYIKCGTIRASEKLTSNRQCNAGRDLRRKLAGY